MKKISTLHFKLTIKNPNLNFFKIQLNYTSQTKKNIFHLPNWSPGSYFIRNYSTHIHKFNSINIKKEPIQFKQNSTSSWEIISSLKKIFIEYEVYSFENTVRTNFLDTEFCFINPPSSFIYPETGLDSKIIIELDQSHFKYVYSSLKKEKKFLYADSFDELYDSPIQLSNRKSIFFKTKHTKHEILIEGDLNEPIKENLVNDLEKITDYENELMEISPNKNYLFILHLIPNTYGGLEHSASSINSFDPTVLYDNSEYKKLLGLLAHEYFHLWNVKRIKPIALGPFDYQKPNYTNELWVAEGITSFYDNYILLKTNILSLTEYLNEVNFDYVRLENSTGELYMSLENSSQTTWNKFYIPNPNSHNTGISYYTKGAILVFCMYIFILFHSNGKKNFTEILIYLYKEYFEKKKRGFTKSEFFYSAKKATGIDLESEFEKYLSKPIRIPIENYLSLIGLERVITGEKKDFGFELEEKKNGYYISKIYKQLPIKNADINLNDELIAINQIRYSKDKLDYILSEVRKNSEVEILLSRRGKVFTTKLTTTTHKNQKIILNSDVPENIKKFRDIFFGFET